MIELRRYSKKLISPPAPPWAIASSGVDSPRTRLKAPRVGSTGSNEPGSENSDLVVDSAVRNIQ